MLPLDPVPKVWLIPCLANEIRGGDPPGDVRLCHVPL